MAVPNYGWDLWQGAKAADECDLKRARHSRAYVQGGGPGGRRAHQVGLINVIMDGSHIGIAGTTGCAKRGSGGQELAAPQHCLLVRVCV